MMIDDRHLYVERCDATTNCARFYALSIERSLLGEICLVRRWGRIGTRGRTRTHPCASEAEAIGLLRDHADAKHRRGYRQRPERAPPPSLRDAVS